MTQRMESYNKGLAREMKSCSHTLAILFEYAWSKARRSLEAGKSMARVWLGGSELRSFRYVAYLLLLMVVGVGEMWGQVNDGIYYIRNDNSSTHGYLWPSLTTNATTGYRYLTTSLATSVDADVNTNGVSYPAHDKSYSHWVVKNVTGGYIQLINPRLNKYVAIRKFPKADNTKENTYGDRDVWLTDEPAAEDIDYTYFVLNNNSSPYKISPKPGLNNVENTSGYSLNSASGNDRTWLTWSKSDNKPQNGEARDGLIQLYSGGTPSWSFTSDLLDAPTINDVSLSTGRVTVTEKNGLPEGYNVRYTTDGNTPTASSSIMAADGYEVTASCTLKVVVERYGVVLTEVAQKEVNPVPCVMPNINYDNTTSMVSITSIFPTSGGIIYYTTNGDTPTTGSIEYGAPFSVTDPTTVKAIVTHSIFTNSEVATLEISRVATPTIQNDGNNAISITTTTPGATIYYTTDGSTPTTTSTEYTGPLTENVSNVPIKAIAVKENMITSAVGDGTVKLQCATPVITRDGMTFTLSCSMPTNANLYYTLGGGSEVAYPGTPVSFTSDQLPMTLTAVARHNDYTQSETASMELLNGSGTSDDPFLIYGATDLANLVTNVNAGTTSSAYYKLETDVSGSGLGAITTPFTGTFDGGMHTISNLGHALFNTVDGGTVKNLVLDNVTISGSTTVDGQAATGAIANVATGATRIYNCGIQATNSTVETDQDGYTKITSSSSTVSGSDYVGGLVGFLDGEARVINCYSYADITSGSYVGGIVGWNNVATTSSNLKTMVMNCMFYGNLTSGNKAPIYNGTIISNAGNSGVGNYNYFRLEASYVQPTGVTYNCALGAETRFLQRFEFYRHLLNSHLELAGWWATDTYSKNEMAKWVLEPSQIGSKVPYPILKTPGKYASVVNYDAENATTTSERNVGGKLGTLTVNIQMGNGAVYQRPTGAAITTPQLTLNITDKDTTHYNFNYYKVQLPYYNDVGTKNYTGNRVVTGWKIVNVIGGTPGSFTTGDDAPAYNFADRNCTNKDLYGTDGSNRIFNQGAYWDVPEGVTAITIEPYWAKCVYLADANADKVYNTNMTTGYDVPNVGGGTKYTNGNSYSIAGENQVVYTSIGNAIASSGTGSALFQGVTTTNHTVYDYAVVLVGNYHNYNSIEAGNGKPYTVTSIDLDGDNEPDYSYILRFDGRKELHPVRVDFINIPGLGMAQKSTGGTGSYNFGIFQPKFWFESTNTSLFRVTQFEYDKSSRVAAPYIVQGGVIEQWVSGQSGGAANKTTYFHVGGNVWFKEFHRGTHQDYQLQSKHPPVSVTGGDYDEFYLTGLYRGDVKNGEDNAECYINGGRFGTVCGAAMEGIGKANGADNTGNIIWQIQNADIKEFYAGGLNAAKPVTGNLSTTIAGSHVGIFCGGPKFGDMSTGKTVTTEATNCTFGTFFGAGYGGNSYSREAPYNHNNIINFPHNTSQAGNHSSWNDWLDDYYTQTYNATYGGVSTQFSYQFLPMSGNADNCARIFVEYVKFSLATTRNVTSTLTGCTIINNFYGGGSLGKVEGDVTSTLDNCTVKGNVFGAGFSAERPTVEVDSIGFRIEPYYYDGLGTYRTGVKGTTTTYTWEHGNSISIDKNNHILYTTENLSNDVLGSVSGTVTLTLQGDTKVGTLNGGSLVAGTGNVFGGGNESTVNNATTPAKAQTIVTLKGNTEVLGNVFGGGNKGKVSGSTEVKIE